MKTILFSLVALFSAEAFAAKITLKPNDSEKLALLIGKLPVGVRTKKNTKLETPACGIRQQSVFESSGLKLSCSSDYFNKSPFPSVGRCSIDIDMTNASVTQQNSEIRVQIKDEKDVKALYAAIPYGKPEKGYWGWERDYGRNFDGAKSALFHFYVVCSTKLCTFKFSSYNLVP